MKKYLAYLVLFLGVFLFVAGCGASDTDDGSDTDGDTDDQGEETDTCPITGITTKGVYDNFATSARDVYAIDDYAYVALYNYGGNDGGLVVIDASSKSFPVKSSSYLPSLSSSSLYPGNVTVEGNYAYITGGSVRQVAKVDISSPSSISYVAQLDGSGASADVYAEGSKLYMTHSDDNAVKVYDVSSSVFSLLDEYNAQTYAEYYSVYSISGNDDNIFCVNHYRILILDKDNLTLEKEMIFDSYPDYFVTNNYLYVAVDGELSVYSLDDPSNPELLGSASISDCSHLVVAFNCAVLVSETTIELYDVSDPSDPQKITSHSVDIENPNGVSIDDYYLYVADGGGGSGVLRIYQLDAQ